MFSVDGMTLIKRLTLIVRDGVIEKVFYPVFPPDASTAEVLEWCGSRQRDRKMQGFRSERVAALRSAKK
jgi:peroxiredoxin